MRSRKLNSQQVHVDRKLRALWNKHSRIIAKAVTRETRAFDERWESAGAIVEHDPPLFLAGGHRNAEEFFRKVLHEAPRSAFRNIRVAEHASPRDEARWGVAKLDAFLSLLEAKQGRPLGRHQRVRFASARVPISKSKTLSLDRATVQQVGAATSRLLHAKGRARKTPERVRSVLRRAFSQNEALSGVEVHEANGFVTLRRVPISAWNHFVAALRSARVDDATSRVR